MRKERRRAIAVLAQVEGDALIHERREGRMGIHPGIPEQPESRPTIVSNSVIQVPPPTAFTAAGRWPPCVRRPGKPRHSTHLGGRKVAPGSNVDSARTTMMFGCTRERAVPAVKSMYCRTAARTSAGLGGTTPASSL